MFRCLRFEGVWLGTRRFESKGDSCTFQQVRPNIEMYQFGRPTNVAANSDKFGTNMADYYPLIARAVFGLDASAPGESRRALYERARSALIAQLRSVQPPLIESEITRERLALEEAILMVESETRRAHETVRQRVGPVAGVGTDIEFEKEPIWKQALYASISFPPVSAIPEQDERRAIAFRLSPSGALDLKPDKTTDAFDPEQSQLYLRLRSQLSKFKDDVPSQERNQIDSLIDDFLDQPPQWELVKFKKVLWLCGNGLRICLANHDAVSSLSEPHYSKLPVGVAEALRKPVETWNVFALGDEDLVQLDAIRTGPQEQAATIAHLQAARPILEIAAANRDITTARAGQALTASLATADSSSSNLNTKQAQDVAERTSRNIVAQLVRHAYSSIQRTAYPETDEDRKLTTQYEHGVVNGLGKRIGSGVGNIALAAAGGAAASAIYYAPQILEFVSTHAALFKEYSAAVYQNEQLVQILNTIEILRLREEFGRSLKNED